MIVEHQVHVVADGAPHGFDPRDASCGAAHARPPPTAARGTPIFRAVKPSRDQRLGVLGGRFGGGAAVRAYTAESVVALARPAGRRPGTPSRLPLMSHSAWSIPEMAELRMTPRRARTRGDADAASGARSGSGPGRRAAAKARRRPPPPRARATRATPRRCPTSPSSVSTSTKCQFWRSTRIKRLRMAVIFMRAPRRQS